MIIRGNRQSLEKKAGALLAGMINRVLQEYPVAVFGVPGGRSIAAVLGSLSIEQVDWTRVHLFMVDERFVPVGHPDANFTAVEAAARSYIPEGNLHPFRYDPAAADHGLEAYHKELGAYGGRFDIVLLSSGEDGHVASLFPDHETILSPADSFIQTFCAPKPPPARMSASRKLLVGARAALLLFLGPGKKDAFSLFSDATTVAERCPAKLVQQVPEHVILAE